MIEIANDYFKRYQEICRRRAGVILDDATARQEFTALVHLVQVVHEHLREHNWPDISKPIE